jgi:hypothetical protein
VFLAGYPVRLDELADGGVPGALAHGVPDPGAA